MTAAGCQSKEKRSLLAKGQPLGGLCIGSIGSIGSQAAGKQSKRARKSLLNVAEIGHACRSRTEAKQRAAMHIAAGNINAAHECYQRGADVTPAMAKQVIEVRADSDSDYCTQCLACCG